MYLTFGRNKTMKKINKEFDCIAMKRHIQEKIYEETKGMNHQEFAEYMQNRIAASRFASFLKRPISGSTHEIQGRNSIRMSA